MPESPIGSIIAFGGGIIDRVWEDANGWLLCDRRPLNRKAADYAALFDAIGFAWGGDAGNMFNIPDLQGYFLRGVDAASHSAPDTPRLPFPVDPDRKDRFQIRPGGNQGDRVGSVQLFGTALPTAKGSEIHLQPAGGTGISCPSTCTPRATWLMRNQILLLSPTTLTPLGWTQHRSPTMCTELQAAIKKLALLTPMSIGSYGISDFNKHAFWDAR